MCLSYCLYCTIGNFEGVKFGELDVLKAISKIKIRHFEPLCAQCHLATNLPNLTRQSPKFKYSSKFSPSKISCCSVCFPMI